MGCGEFLWLPLLLLAALLTNIVSADQALISSICSTTRNKALCLQVLRNSVADRAGLGQIASGAALENAQSAMNLIKSLATKAKDPREKDEYSTCLEVYGDTIDYLKECKTLFGNKDYRTANVKASAAFDGVDTCSDEAATSAPPQLKTANAKAEDYISIVLSASNV